MLYILLLYYVENNLDASEQGEAFRLLLRLVTAMDDSHVRPNVMVGRPVLSAWNCEEGE